MTNSFAVLFGWLEFLALVGVLCFFLLRGPR